MDELHLLATRTDATVTITVGGELDIATAPALVTFLRDNVRDGDDHLILDLDELSFIGATGLGLLVGLHARMKRQDTVLTMTGTSEHFRKLLKITSLDALLALAREVSPDGSRP
jgi:anti-anti-sigma factor